MMKSLGQKTFRFRLRFPAWLAAIIIANCLLSVAVTPRLAFGQKLKELNISGVSTQVLTNGTLVSIAADGSLSRAQMWQDGEGYHVVVPHAVTRNTLKTEKGVKVRHIGQSLEILVQTRPGAKVVARSSENALNLSIEGKLEPRFIPTEIWENNSAVAKIAEQRVEWQVQSKSEVVASGGVPASSESLSGTSSSSTTTQVSQPLSDSSAPLVSANNPPTSPVSNGQQIVPQGDGTTVNVPPGTQAQIVVQPEDDGVLASMFSGTSVLIILVVGILGLVVGRKLRSRQNVETGLTRVAADEIPKEDKGMTAVENAGSFDVSHESLSMVPRNGFDPGVATVKERRSTVQLPVTTPSSLFGAYRIDQEVGKLVLGQPHRMDVLASRAPDDRRAIETSLLKTISSPQADESMHRRAREALEEYGFVARHSAAMLLAPDAFDRTLAARTLGEIQSPTALPFLLEALYDYEPIVRNQAVLSIGELRIPSAIGALLDMARKHPDVPGSLLSRALSACSVGGLDFFDTPVPPTALLSGSSSEAIVHEITYLEPAASVEDLPQSTDDEKYTAALTKLMSEEFDERSRAIKDLGQFQVQSAVQTLSASARQDPHPGIRALAMASLASINHESVFPSVLIGMADESREVRAAAARALSRLGFDRADAYVRVMETADEKTLVDVARACIQAGIVSQEIDRLASSDRRQAYEAFCLLSLAAKANMSEPILEAILNHEKMDVRLASLRLLATSGRMDVIDQLRELVANDRLDEEVTTALLEILYKFDQAQAAQSLETPSTTMPLDPQPVLEVVAAKIESDEGPIYEPKVDDFDS
jgi:HEAT repeat protein